FKGLSEASSPSTAWRAPSFDDSGWFIGTAPIGYGENFISTLLSDMPGLYSSVFFRQEFVVDDPSAITGLILEAQYDDGFKVWINGTNVLNANISSGEVPFDGFSGPTRESANYDPFTLNSPRAYLVPGKNIIAIQAHNVSLSGSTDFFLDVRLTGQIGSANRGPTPGAINSVYATNLPPQIRQVDDSPELAVARKTGIVTAEVNDDDGGCSVGLLYHVVSAGIYVRLNEP